MADRYEIREKIGQGGLGEVYVAYDTQLGREVALKRMRATEEEKAAKDDDLFKEAKVMSTLMHPNVVTIFDVGHDEHGPFAVMELLKGETFDRTVERGALTLEDFRRFVQQTLEGMIAAQAIGLMHRDSKPGNLMVIWLPSGKFQVKILDFGLAKFSQKPSEQTSDQGDGIMGSIYFMAPEQFERLPLDKPTDMYALGCVYYYGLTQQHPFEGDSPAQVMASHLRHDVKELSELRPDLPEEICTWVMWMINRQPEDRPADANEALEYFREGGEGHEAPAQAAPPTRPLLVTGPAATAVRAQAPPGLAVGDQTAYMLSGSQPAGTASQPLGAGAAYLASKKKGGGARAGAAKAGGAGRKGTFPMWALVTFPLLLVAAIGFGGYSMYQSGQQRKKTKHFEAMFEEARPQGDAGTVRDMIARMQQDGDVAVAAATILSKLEGPGVSQEMINQLPNVKGKALINLMRAVAMRGYEGASAALAEVADTTTERELRIEALGALAQVTGEKDLPLLVSLLPEMEGDQEKGMLQEAIVRVLRGRRSQELRTEPLIAQLRSAATPELKAQILSMLGRIGGTTAIEAIYDHIDSPEDPVSSAAMLALSQWPTAEPAERLLGVASGDGSDVRRSVALLAYVRLAGSASDIPMSRRVSMLEEAFSLAREIGVARVERDVFGELSSIPDESALAFAEEMKGDERIGRYASNAIAGIKRGLQRVIQLEPSGGSLLARSAYIFGPDARYASRTDGEGVISNWNGPHTTLIYTVGIVQEGTYAVKLVQAATAEHGGSYEIDVAGINLVEEVKTTGSETEFTVAVLGDVVFGEPGNYELVVRPLDITGDEGLMIMQGVELEFLN
ncbi:hypothetical protein BH23VER1_BH23VER1_20570 [soil metagenome]